MLQNGIHENHYIRKTYTGTPLYEISKYIAKILKPLGKLKEQHTQSSKSFSAFICQQKIEPDGIMVSFDVTSLYTTTPIDQALLIMKDLSEHDDKLADRTLLSPNISTRTTKTHQQFTSQNTIHQRRRQQLPSSISPKKSSQ